MKYRGLSVIVGLAVLAGCAAGLGDARLASAPRTLVQVDGQPIEVAVVPADGTGTLYDVEARAASASKARALAEADAQPLMAQARYRAAAMMEMERRYGKGRRLEVVSEDAVSAQRAMRLRVAIKPK